MGTVRLSHHGGQKGDKTPTADGTIPNPNRPQSGTGNGLDDGTSWSPTLHQTSTGRRPSCTTKGEHARNTRTGTRRGQRIACETRKRARMTPRYLFAPFPLLAGPCKRRVWTWRSCRYRIIAGRPRCQPISRPYQRTGNAARRRGPAGRAGNGGSCHRAVAGIMAANHTAGTPPRHSGTDGTRRTFRSRSTGPASRRGNASPAALPRTYPVMTPWIVRNPMEA